MSFFLMGVRTIRTYLAYSCYRGVFPLPLGIYTGSRAMFGEHTELTEVSGTGIDELTEVSGTDIEAVPNLADDFGRVFTEKVHRGIAWYLVRITPYRAPPWDYLYLSVICMCGMCLSLSWRLFLLQWSLLSLVRGMPLLLFAACWWCCQPCSLCY